VARRIDGAWTPPRPVHADGWTITGCPVNGPATAAHERDVVVGWYTYADQRASVRLAFSTDAAATFAAPVVVDEPHATHVPLGRVDVALAAPDQAIVSWVAAEGETARWLVRRVGRAGARGAALEVARFPLTDRGLPRMERLGDDLLFAWTDAARHELRVARLRGRDVPPLDAPREAAGGGAIRPRVPPPP
jgi:hypothetical protein